MYCYAVQSFINKTIAKYLRIVIMQLTVFKE